MHGVTKRHGSWIVDSQARVNALRQNRQRMLHNEVTPHHQ